jgi:hypothetical protein
MFTEITEDYAEENFFEILEQIIQRQSFAITNGGCTIALLSPPGGPVRPQRERFALSAFRTARYSITRRVPALYPARKATSGSISITLMRAH